LVAGEIIEIQPNLVETKTTRKKGAQRAKKGKFSPLLPPEEMVWRRRKRRQRISREDRERGEKRERGGDRKSDQDLESGLVFLMGKRERIISLVH